MSEERGLVRCVRLWNDGSKDFDSVVTGTRRVIPAGKFIELSRREAIDIRGQYFGKNNPVSLRIEPLPEKGYDGPKEMQPVTGKERIYCCPVCDKEFALKDDMLKCKGQHKKPGRPPRKAVKNDSEPSVDNDTKSVL